MIAGLGLFATATIAAPSLGYFIAVGGFLAGLFIFVAPLYYIAVQDQNEYLSKAMPIGGLGMLSAWLALIFA